MNNQCKKQNCWEHKECGREIGGKNSIKLGVCPAAMDGESSGVTDGRDDSRCWVEEFKKHSLKEASNESDVSFFKISKNFL